MTRRSRNRIRLEALYRLMLLRLAANRLPILLVTEYPKSGASWLCQLLSDLSDYEFPRQRLPSLKPSVFHGHYLMKNPPKKTVVFWRDPRDIMVSWYHHCLFKTDMNNHQLVDQVRSLLGFDNLEDVRGNLPAFIEYTFNQSLSPRFSFNDFFDRWYSSQAVHARYESLLADPKLELIRILTELALELPTSGCLDEVIERYSFRRQAARDPGHENKNHYLRKGVAGDWVNHFEPATEQLLFDLTGDRMALLGYDRALKAGGD